MIQELRKKQKNVKLIVIIGSLMVVFAYIVNMVVWHNKIANNDPPLCDGKDFMNSDVY